MPILAIIVIAVLAIAAYLIATYNRFVTIKTQIEASIQEIGNQLKRQADLIPNLENSVKGFLKHEKGIFEELTSARKAVETAVKSGTAKALDAAEEQVSAVLPKIQILVESNPEIKSAELVGNLMNELRDTADKLMYARRTVIDLTQDFNQMLVTIPSSLVGTLFGMTKQSGLSTPMSGTHLEVAESETKSPKINL
ncbi:hypothetical protein A2368_04435 [Candidatus Collierbacteria bacterium RIFOXYB1_FULL_49_13]|uniref:LemA family protein n=1 Tax=Candidatus Collierbacteria bacterium RIFOXYB1_FULL_49_13 TaxID=1817728 RepID=A0A1F5FJH0_9BACT|nr:MAG: hypothetical protein A2368_04435 [Candidatus Collierbacteria bacterium RIFOXYB1_FULL_49_13]